MKTLIFVFLTLATTFASAQITANWKGGTPGQETNWNYAKNWSNNEVPGEFTHIVIAANNTGYIAMPVINDYVAIASLQIQPGASLHITGKGVLKIDGEYTYSNGILMYGGLLINNGKIILSNVELERDAFQLDKIQGNGIMFLDGQQVSGDVLAKY